MKSNDIAIKNDLSHLKNKYNKKKSNKIKLYLRRNAKVYPLNLYYNKPNPTYNYIGLTNYKHSSTSMNSNYSFSNSDTVSNNYFNKQTDYDKTYKKYNTFTTQNLSNINNSNLPYQITNLYDYDNSSSYYKNSIHSEILTKKNKGIIDNKHIFTNNIKNNNNKNNHNFGNSVFTNNTKVISNLNIIDNNNYHNNYHNLSWFKRLKNKLKNKNKVDNLRYNKGIYNRKKDNSDRKIVKMFYLGLLVFVIGICFI